MIGKLTGRIEHVFTDHILLDVNGVGYLVFCSERTLASLPPTGDVASLYTDLLVREDNLQLFGFLTISDREWHKLLVTVQGVGAKVALAIAGRLGTDGLSRAITLGDVPAIKSAPGVGPKLAQRIATELKDKAHLVMSMGQSATSPAIPKGDDVIDDGDRGMTATSIASSGAQADALSALANLGYAHVQAAEAIAIVSDQAEGGDASALIKAALKHLAKANG